MLVNELVKQQRVSHTGIIIQVGPILIRLFCLEINIGLADVLEFGRSASIVGRAWVAVVTWW